MGYLALAVTSSVLVSSVMRISKKYTSEDKNITMLMINYFVCIVLAFLYNGKPELSAAAGDLWFCLLIGAVNGFLYLMGFVLLQINVEKNGVAMSSTFMRLGVLVPTLLSITVFHEIPRMIQIVGFIIALGGIIYISTDPGDGDKQKKASDFKLGLILMLLSGGTADAMSKVFNTYGAEELSNLFLAATFIFAFLFCCILFLQKKQKFGLSECLFGVLIAIPNYYSARFLLLAVARVQAFVAYPTYSVGTIIVSGIVGVVFFKERMNQRQMISLASILVALVLLNI